jgi:hypothetical protein
MMKTVQLIAMTTIVAAAVTASTAQATSSMTFAGSVDYDGDSYTDIVARDPAGLLWLYPGDGTRAYSTQARVQIGNGWGGMTFAGVVDYDNDGNADIIARDSTGLLWLYPGDGTRAYSTQGRAQIGNGWNGMTFAGVVDYDSDGNADIIARDSTGLLWLYPGEGTRDYSGQGRVQIGNGWSGMAFAGVVDYDNDGNPDIVARDSTGFLWLYPGEGTRAYSGQARVQIGNGWNGMTFAGVVDYDSDSSADIIARDPTGLLWLYPGEGTRAYSGQARVQIGNGW